MTFRRAHIDLGDLSHLSTEDAELYRALYLERNYVPRREADRVRKAIHNSPHRRASA